MRLMHFSSKSYVRSFIANLNLISLWREAICGTHSFD